MDGIERERKKRGFDDEAGRQVGKKSYLVGLWGVAGAGNLVRMVYWGG